MILVSKTAASFHLSFTEKTLIQRRNCCRSLKLRDMLNSSITLIKKNIFSLSTVSVVRLSLHYISARKKRKTNKKPTNKQTHSPELYHRIPKLTNSRVQTGKELAVCALYLQGHIVSHISEKGDCTNCANCPAPLQHPLLRSYENIEQTSQGKQFAS